MPGGEGKEEACGTKDRGRTWSYLELLYCLFAALDTNEKFSDGKPSAVRLATFNETYIQRVKWMKEQDKWRDQHGKTVTHITSEQSIQEQSILNNPISIHNKQLVR